jgi:hypothetical protein
VSVAVEAHDCPLARQRGACACYRAGCGVPRWPHTSVFLPLRINSAIFTRPVARL